MRIYLTGSLENPRIPDLAIALREAGHSVFDDWFAAGPDADKMWKVYEQRRGRTYVEAVRAGLAAQHVFDFDRFHLSQADIVILAMPCGKSGCLELGWALGQGKLGYVLLDDPTKWDVMFKFATNVFDNLNDLLTELAQCPLQPCSNSQWWGRWSWWRRVAGALRRICTYWAV